jgi:hypothetical protein
MGRSVTMYVGNENTAIGQQTLRNMERTKSGKNSSKTDGRKQTGSLYAGDMLNGDSIIMKKQMAQKKALKVISDAFAGDISIDDEISGHHDKLRQLKEDKSVLNDWVTDITDSEKKLQSEYGVADDSEEQEDAELLIKWKEYVGGVSSEGISEDDKNRVEELLDGGLTEYQSRLLDMHDDAIEYKRQIKLLDNEIQVQNQTISDIKIERLKSSPMKEAVNEADEIMENAGKEILGMLFEEGKDNIDEKQEKEQDKAEILEEKKEEQEEFIEKIKDGREEDEEEIEELTEEIVSGSDNSSGKTVSEVQQEVKNMLSKMKLIEEDIKGAQVDETL